MLWLRDGVLEVSFGILQANKRKHDKAETKNDGREIRE
jgi:hypothetical protein